MEQRNRVDLSFWLGDQPPELSAHLFKSGGSFISVNFTFGDGNEISIVGRPHALHDLLTAAALAAEQAAQPLTSARVEVDER